MPRERANLECRSCGRETIHLRSTPDHTLHLVLSLVTFGLWLLVWLVLWLLSGRAECRVCGTTRRSGIFGTS